MPSEKKNQKKKIFYYENTFVIQKLFNTDSYTTYVKDAFHRYIVNNELEAIQPDQRGTKVCAHYILKLKPNESFQIKVKLDNRDHCDDASAIEDPFLYETFDEVFEQRKTETDEFYSKVISSTYCYTVFKYTKKSFLKVSDVYIIS